MSVGLLLRRTFTSGLLPEAGPVGMVWLNVADETIGIMGENNTPAVIISTKTGQIVLPDGQTIDKAADEFWRTVRFLATEKLPILPEHRNVAYRPTPPPPPEDTPPESWLQGLRRFFDW